MDYLKTLIARQIHAEATPQLFFAAPTVKRGKIDGHLKGGVDTPEPAFDSYCKIDRVIIL